MRNYFNLLSDKQILKAFYRGLKEAKNQYHDIDVNSLMKRALVFNIRDFVGYLAELDLFPYARLNHTEWHQLKNVTTLAICWVHPRHERGWDIPTFYRHLYDLAENPWTNHHITLLKRSGYSSFRSFYNDRDFRKKTLGYLVDRSMEKMMCNPFYVSESDVDWMDYNGILEDREITDRKFSMELDFICHYHIPAALDD